MSGCSTVHRHFSPIYKQLDCTNILFTGSAPARKRTVEVKEPRDKLIVREIVVIDILGNITCLQSE